MARQQSRRSAQGQPRAGLLRQIQDRRAGQARDQKVGEADGALTDPEQLRNRHNPDNRMKTPTRYILPALVVIMTTYGIYATCQIARLQARVEQLQATLQLQAAQHSWEVHNDNPMQQ